MNIPDVLASLNIMWKGMLGLFVVCGFVAVLIMLISKINSVKQSVEKKE
jgi:hypothetical protein